jgi:hypothetical protein
VSAKPRRSECRFPASERPFDTRCIERRQLGELGDLAVGRDRGADCRSDHIGNRAPEVPRTGGDGATRKGKLRPARRRTSETVVRTHVVVITAHAEGGRVASTRPEVDLIKAAILYADSVEVLSLGNQLIRSLDGHASGDATGPPEFNDRHLATAHGSAQL